MCHSIVYLPICLFQALILNLPCYFSYRNRAMPLCITGVVCWFVSSSVMSFSDSRAAWYFLCRRPQTCTLSQQHISTLLPVPFPSVSSIWIPFFFGYCWVSVWHFHRCIYDSFNISTLSNSKQLGAQHFVCGTKTFLIFFPSYESFHINLHWIAFAV